MGMSLFRRHGAGDRGSVAVEAALIFPILVLMVFGAIEWAAVFKDKVELTSVARAGARSASALSPKHPWVAPGTPFTRQVVDAVESAASALPRSSIEYILVYQANEATGRPLSGTFNCAAADSTCDRYTWDQTLNAGLGGFKPTTGQTWTGSTINACQGESGMQSVGVYIKANHAMYTGLFGTSKAIASYTVMRFEPQTPGRCKP